METNAPLINVSSLRTGKEKFYLVVFCILAFGVWIWLLFSVFRQFAIVFSTKNDTSICYIRDRVNNTVNKVEKKYLLPGEQCLSRSELTKEEQKELKASEEEVFDTSVLSLTTPVLFLFYALLGLFFHYIAVAFIRINAVKIGSNQFPALWEAMQRFSIKIGVHNPPDIFVLNGNGMLNAFAAKLVFRKIIVLYSDLVEALVEEKDQKQLEAVMAHELGHHVLGHTNIFLDWFLSPLLYIPFFGLPLSRAREYSSDRVMKALVSDKEACEKALIKLAAGKILGNQTNISEYLKQRYEETGFFTWIAEKLSTHPHLPNRIAALDDKT